MGESAVRELELIDRKAYHLAVAVLECPELREHLVGTARRLQERLLEIAEDLEKSYAAPGKYSEQVSEALLDLGFVEEEVDAVSLRLGEVMAADKRGGKPAQATRRSPFPLPANVLNLDVALRSDRISFQTTLSLSNIAEFYRAAFKEQGFREHGLLSNLADEFLTLVFEKLESNEAVILVAVDLAFASSQDLRNVNIHTDYSLHKRISESVE